MWSESLVDGGKAIRILPDETNPRSKGYACAKGMVSLERINHSQRLLHPLSRNSERIKAYVVFKKDIKSVSSYDLMKWCQERLASYKVPQYIEFRDMLPKSNVGKLLRRELRAEDVRNQRKIKRNLFFIL